MGGQKQRRGPRPFGWRGLGDTDMGTAPRHLPFFICAVFIDHVADLGARLSPEVGACAPREWGGGDTEP